MRTPLLGGIAAGAVGTIALDVVTYLDMVVRARPASSTSAEVAGALAEGAGVELAPAWAWWRWPRATCPPPRSA